MKLFYSKGLVKLIFVPTLFASICSTYCSAFYLLYPMATSYYRDLLVWVISRFLSVLGAKGFLIIEFPLGSVILIVNGNFLPYKYS